MYKYIFHIFFSLCWAFAVYNGVVVGDTFAMNLVTFCVWLVGASSLIVLTDNFAEELSRKPARPEWISAVNGVIDVAIIGMLVGFGHWALGAVYLIACCLSGGAIEEAKRIREARGSEAEVTVKKQKKAKVTKIKI